MGSKRIDVKAILADADLRRKLMVSTIQATQAREGIDTTHDQADRAYSIVNEGERTSFFDLERFKSGRRGEDSRELHFAQALRGDSMGIRFDVARRDFAAIDGCPLAYRRIGLIAHAFREHAALEPSIARARRGAYTGNDAQYVRNWWEPGQTPSRFTWEPFAKGGDFCRFYSDVDLVVHWDPARRTFADFHGRKGRETERPESLEDYFKPGLTWPRRTQRGFNVRVLPEGCVFADKGPSIFPNDPSDRFFILGVFNAGFVQYVLQGLTSFGSWETAAVKHVPVPRPLKKDRERIARLAEDIYRTKANWDTGNETATSFVRPWCIGAALESSSEMRSLADRLDALAELERATESELRRWYAEIDNEVYRLYGIPDSSRMAIEEALGDRPPEILWPQMEATDPEQKRMEHVWRLLSYAVKRVLEVDNDAIVSFNPVNGEPGLAERVRQELATLFSGRDANQVEVEIVNELKRTVKGYRKCASIDEWLNNAFFEYHCGLYRRRPIFWHIVSAQGTARFAFGALVHYHRFDKNRMAKLRSTYLRDAVEGFRREAALADKAGRADDRLEWQAKVEEAQALDKKLQFIQEGYHEGSEGGDRDYRILTPWKKPGDRPKGWDPDLDDGVEVNIEPFEKAGVLRVGKVT